MAEKQSGLLESLEQLFVPRRADLDAVGSDAWFRTATELERIEWCCRAIFNELLLKPPIVQTSVGSLEEAQEILESGALGLMSRFRQIGDEDDRREAYEDLGLVMEAILYFGKSRREQSVGATGSSTVVKNAKGARRRHAARILSEMFDADPVKGGLMTHDHLWKLVLEKLATTGGAKIGSKTLERAREIAWK